MKKALIHIGSGKTGSTSIQKSLISYVKNKHSDFSFPVVDTLGNQNIDCLFKPAKRFSRALKSRLNAKGIKPNKYQKAFKNKFLKEYEDSKNLILSSEYFFNLNSDEIEKLYVFLKEELKIDEVQVVCYLRSPADYYLSFVQQQIKASSKYPVPSSFRYNMLENIKCWEDTFPNIVVRQFSKKQLVNEDVVLDFNNIINDFFDIKINLEPMKFNESLSALSMVTLQHYRKTIYGSKDGEFNKSSRNLLNMLLDLSAEEKKPRLKKTVDATIQNNHKNQIVYFQNHYGLFKDLVMKEDDLSDCSIFNQYDVSEILMDEINESDILAMYAKITEVLTNS
ncbi:hypothetical protein [Vreelandella titanicae]|uniref:hypothetical protein n=1 Tax=Vreelandella titanicae TaxID=664683 RepID=UPI003D2D7779